MVRVYEEKDGFGKTTYDREDAKDSKEVVDVSMDAMAKEEEVAYYADVCEDNIGQLKVDHCSRI